MFARPRHALLLAASAAALAVPTLAPEADAATGSAPSFDGHRTLSIGSSITDPRSLLVTDLDGDGRPDLVTGSANGGTGQVSVLRGTGPGTFAAPLGSPFGLAVAGGVGAVAAGDLNGDGHPDVVATIGSGTAGNDQLVPLAGDGAGNLTAGTPVTIGDQLSGVALADLDGDGDLDAFTSSMTATSGDQLGVLELGPSGLSPSGTAGAAGTQLAADVAAGDIDADGTPDALVISRNAGTGSAWVATGSGMTRTAGPAIAVGGDPVAVALSDIDGDGDLDGLVLDGSAALLTVLRNDGAGGLTATGVTVTGLAAGSGLAAGDLNGDGHPDLVITDDAAGAVAVMDGDGAGGFGEPSWHTTGAGPRSPVIADLTGDGVPDIATADAAANSLSLLRNVSVGIAQGTLTGSFGSQAVSSTGVARTVTFVNTGAESLLVSGISVAGADADDFLITHDDCTGSTLHTGGVDSCTVRVRFAPSAAGARSALLRLRFGSSGAADVALAGSGLDAAATTTTTTTTTGTTTTTTAATTAEPDATTTSEPEIVIPPILTKAKKVAKPKSKRLLLTKTAKQLSAKPGATLRIGFTLSRAAKIVVRVKRAGRTVDIVRLSGRKGRGLALWDGMLGRKAAPAGSYRLDVYAVAADGRAARASIALTLRG